MGMGMEGSLVFKEIGAVFAINLFSPICETRRHPVMTPATNTKNVRIQGFETTEVGKQRGS